MTTFITSPTDFIKVTKDNKAITLYRKEKYDTFNESILGLGNIENKSDQIHALSVLFDLEGFTNFCTQIDPHLAVPEYLSAFLKWLFGQIKMELIDKTFPEGYKVFSELPFLSKFMGDGILFLWDTNKLSENEILNIVVSMRNICTEYEKVFYQDIITKISSPPRKLRCGIARGAIYSVGNGNDFVGPCINMSARLQKLNSLPFCFSRRGLNPDVNPNMKEKVITMKTEIRGIGSDELVCMMKIEYDALSEIDKAKFSQP
jgi:hypothetical protein